MPEWSTSQNTKEWVDYDTVVDLLSTIRKTEDLTLASIADYVGGENAAQELQILLTNATVLMVAEQGVDPDSNTLDTPEFWAKVAMMGFISGFIVGHKSSSQPTTESSDKPWR